ncbi:MAG: hypothetical protein Q8P18_01100 [Pseudomonadota bacterium]|nr:hypothetical protein [Pseudomonadota bacterium]
MVYILLACAMPEDTGAGLDTGADPTFYPPDAPGPFIAGTEEASFVGASTVADPEGLAYTVQVWFPASEADTDPYRYDDLLEGAAREDGVPDCSAPRPVLVFSHGNGGVRYQSIFLTEHLATHGWVVVAPDHPGNTLFDDSSSRGELTLRRPVDAVAAYDWLVDVAAAPGGLLEGCVDPDAGYAIAGHSFGGYTTLVVAGATLDAAASAEWCATPSDEWLCDDFAGAMAEAGETLLHLGDPRVWAAVPMAPAGYEVLVGGLADIAVPMMVMGGSLDTITTMEGQVTPIYSDLAVAPRFLGEVEGAGHFTFSDACTILPTYDECSPPFLSATVAHPIIATATTAFLQWVRGEEQAEAWLPDPAEARWRWTEQR